MIFTVTLLKATSDHQIHTSIPIEAEIIGRPQSVQSRISGLDTRMGSITEEEEDIDPLSDPEERKHIYSILNSF